MAYVTAKDLSERINIHAIVEESRTDWEKRERKRRRLEAWVVRSIPIGLVLMSVIFYSLSAPHTAGILSIITPFWGLLAPLAFELGIVIVSALMEAGWRNWLSQGMLWALVLMSVIINVAGAFIAVVEKGSTENAIAGATVAELLSRYGSLPAAYQVVLALVIPVGAVIPLMAKLTGEIIIKLAMGKIQLESTSDEERWLKDRARAVYGALMQAAIKEGAGAATSGGWAAAVTKQLFREVESMDLVDARAKRTPRVTGETMAQPAMSHRGIGFRGVVDNVGQDRTGQSEIDASQSLENGDFVPSKDKNRLSRAELVQWLSERPALQAKHPRELARLYTAEVYGVASDSGYKSFERAKRDMGL